MRRLAQPEVLTSAFLGALATTLLCYPRLYLWSTRTLPLWYLEATLFLGGFVLWAFVFAWHTEYAKRPVLASRIKRADAVWTTVAGVLVAVALYLLLDPTQRLRTPEDYPDNIQEWIAKTLFSLAFLQLFLVFAPFAWLMRLFKTERVATALTISFGVMVLSLKAHASPAPMSAPVFAALLGMRIMLGFLSIAFYLRGGLLLCWWWGLLIEARHLPALLWSNGS